MRSTTSSTTCRSDQYETVQGFDNVSLTFVPSFYGEWITFNTQLPPFDNVQVRQAMNYAVDKAGLRALYRPESPETKATLVYPTHVDLRGRVASGLGCPAGL